MTSDIADVAAFASAIASGVDVFENLTQLNVVLEGNRSSAEQLSLDILRFLPLDALFGYMADGSDKQTDLAHRLTKKILGSLPPATLASSEYSRYFLAGFAHDRASVRELSTSELKRVVEDKTCIPSLMETSVLPLGLQRIADEDLSVAKHSVDALVSLAWSAPGLEALGNPAVQAVIKELVNGCVKRPVLESRLFASGTQATGVDTTRFRLYEAMVRASAISGSALDVSRDVGLLDRLMSDITLDDPLTTVNVVELFAMMSGNSAAFDFVLSSGALKTLNAILLSVDDPMACIISPAIFRFWANLAQLKETNFEHLFRDYQLGNAFVGHMVEGDPATKQSAISSLGAIGATATGVRVLCEDPALLRAFLRNTSSTNDDIKIAALHSLAHMLSQQDGLDEALQHSIYSMANENLRPTTLLDVLVELAKRPFHSTRYAAYHVMRALASQPWGRQVLTKQAGFLEFMINRKLELERDGMDWKYAIIKNWALGGDSGAGSDTNHRKLLSYIRQGPYYRDTQPQVATQQA